jgi:hypothetical protein
VVGVARVFKPVDVPNFSRLGGQVSARQSARARHAEEFACAVAHGLPLAEARRRLAADKHRATVAALEVAREKGRTVARHTPHSFVQFDAPWMQRN